MNTRFAFFFCSLFVLLASCSKSSNPVAPEQTVTVFDTTAFPANEYFQANGLPSLDGWTFHPSIPGDTITFDPFGPPTNSTAWSITLRKSDVPPVTNNVTKSFIHCTSGVYSFTVWLTMKKPLPDTTYNPVGSIAIIRQRNGMRDTASMTSSDSIIWHPVTLLDILTLLPTDTVTLMLASGACDSSCHGNPLWFDDITFKKLP
ncbi:MAG TPA: hypothetical protein VFH95_09000 [Candidatus Kapabacteria bacterium]|nr:hypothetical protein [Candidatus Kapabacteria bacterium]